MGCGKRGCANKNRTTGSGRSGRCEQGVKNGSVGSWSCKSAAMAWARRDCKVVGKRCRRECQQSALYKRRVGSGRAGKSCTTVLEQIQAGTLLRPIWGTGGREFKSPRSDQ